MAIGLAAMAARVIGGEEGAMLQTVILSSSILYELIGPGCAKLALYLSKSYGQEKEPEVVEPTRAESLKEQLSRIEAELAKEEYGKTEEERAYNDAAEEEFTYGDYLKYNRKFINRR